MTDPKDLFPEQVAGWQRTISSGPGKYTGETVPYVYYTNGADDTVKALRYEDVYSVMLPSDRVATWQNDTPVFEDIHAARRHILTWLLDHPAETVDAEAATRPDSCGDCVSTAEADPEPVPEPDDPREIWPREDLFDDT